VKEDGRRATEPVGAEEVRRRASAGAALLAARAALVVALGLGANIVLARLLVPRDFGLVALGTVLITLGGYLSDGGLGAGLIRRADAPTGLELQAVNGLQLGATVSLTLLAAAGAAAFGRDAAVIAVMVASLPITILRAPSIIVLERRLDYRTIATADIAEAVAFYAWAVATVALGMGVWGLASAMVVRAAVGTAVMVRRGPVGLVRPRWSWASVRPLLGFGLKLQAISAVAIARDQGLNLAVAAIAGVATLGVWNLAFRVLQIPTLLFTTVSRVSYASMSRLLTGGSDPRSAIERGVATLTVISAALLVAIVGFAPALPSLVGHAWDEVPATLALSCAAILLNAPVFVMTVGYLYAVDAAGAVLRAMSAYAAVWFAVSVPLLPALGAPAIGLGWIAAAAVGSVLLSRPTSRRTGASIWRNLLPASAAAGAAGAAGWEIAMAAHQTALAGVLGAAAAELLLFAALALVRRPLLVAAYDLVVDGVRGATAPRTARSV
jgi:polysaccharide transporter, PST family